MFSLLHLIFLFTELIETESEPPSFFKIIHWPIYQTKLPLRVTVNFKMELPKICSMKQALFTLSGIRTQHLN